MAQNINEIYMQISKKEISLDEGVKRIIVCIYTAPALFGLANVDSDLKNDIILKLLEQMPKYIANYSNSKSGFSTYVTAVILNLRKTEYRNIYRKKAHESSILYYLNEKGSTVTDVLADSGSFFEQTDFYTSLSDNAEMQGKKLKPKHILILALKACHYLDENQISRLSRLTGYEEAQVAEYKRRLEQSMQRRMEQYKEIQCRLNSSYMLKNRCFLQLMTLPPDSALFSQLTRTYAYYTHSWKNRLRLYRRSGRLRPTNIEIAKVLDMKLHQVYQALRYIRNITEKNVNSGYVF